MKIYDYDPKETWCREGVAVEQDHGTFDTYWGVSGSDRHRLTPEEMTSLKLRFESDEYDRLSGERRTVRQLWIQYAPADRQSIPSQHGLQRQLYIRKGSKPDLVTRIENAKDALEEAEQNLRSAEFQVQWKREALEKLQAGVS